VDYRKVHCEILSPVPRLQEDVRWVASVSGDFHFAVMWNSGLRKDLAGKGLSAKVPIPESRLVRRHAVVAEDVHRASV